MRKIKFVHTDDRGYDISMEFDPDVTAGEFIDRVEAFMLAITYHKESILEAMADKGDELEDVRFRRLQKDLRED